MSGKRNIGVEKQAYNLKLRAVGRKKTPVNSEVDNESI